MTTNEARSARLDIAVTTHSPLKTWPKFFDAVSKGTKTFELRRDDRSYAVGDIVDLREWDPETEQYTGRAAIRDVVYVLRASDITMPGLLPGFVILGLAPVFSTLPPSSAGDALRYRSTK